MAPVTSRTVWIMCISVILYASSAQELTPASNENNQPISPPNSVSPPTTALPHDTTIAVEHFVSSHPKDFSRFRVCSTAATGGDLFRFNLDQECPSTTNKEHNEGVLLIFKKNIVPYIFKVRRYRKIATSVTVYSGMYDAAITNKDEISRPVPLYEIKNWDSLYQCFNALKITVNGYTNLYVDRDYVNQTVNLQPVDGLTNNIQRYFSQPKLYTDPSWFPGIYRVRTTVNCEITDMIARSIEPYDYFVTALGDTVEVSPFCSGNSQCLSEKTQNKNGFFTQVVNNHTIVNYADRGSSLVRETRIFAENEAYSISWKAETQKQAVCSHKIWKSFPRTIRTTHESSYHFVANEVTATFTTPLEEVNNFTQDFGCLNETIQTLLKSSLEKLASDYVTNGTVQYFKTEGGLYLVWQPIVHKEFYHLNISNESLMSEEIPVPSPTPSTETTTVRTLLKRRRREVNNTTESISEASNIATPQLQFAYDKLKSSVNGILEELAKSWCREQVRSTRVLYELSKINPSSVMSAIYGRPVAASFTGDVLSVTECLEVDQTSINIHKNLRTRTPNVCYTRPPVTFKFVNSSALFTGQLGTRNEILLSTNMVETCRDACEHYFITGNITYHYKNYEFVKTINTSEINTLDTFIALNVSMIENIDFKIVELYSQSEKRMSNVFDIETVFREYNYYTQRLDGIREDLDNTIDLNRDKLVRDISDMMADLGGVGKVLVNAASSVITVFGSIVSGFISFFKNPLGGILIILILVGVVVLIFVLRKRTASLAAAPITMLMPQVAKEAEHGNIKPMDEENVKSLLLGLKEMHDARQQPQTPSAWHKMKDMVVRKRPGYQKLPQSSTDESTLV